MSFISAFKYTPVAVTLLMGSAAMADVTAEQVWDSWSKQMEIYGEGFSFGDVTQTGDILIVNDVKLDVKDDDLTVLAAIGDIALTDNGDGTVNIVLPDSYPVTMTFTPQFEDQTIANLSVTQTDMAITVSGEPGAYLYDMSAEEYAFTLESVEGADTEDLDLGETSLVFRALSGNYSVTEGDVNAVRYSMNLGAVDLDVNLSQINGENRFLTTVDITDLAMAATLMIPAEMDMEADAPPFADGLAMDGGYSFGATKYDFDIFADGEGANGQASIERGGIDFAFDYDRLVYKGNADGITAEMRLPQDTPFPLNMSMASYGFDLEVPLSQGSSGPRDARLAFDFTEFAVSNAIWNLIDPQEILPRDPVTLALGLDLKVTPFFDLLDPSQQKALAMTDVPGELNAAQLSELTIRGAGAEITGSGGFTFDNTDLNTFDGFPRPEGEVTFAINGVNTLIDNLIDMGLIPQEEVMMPRMMLGMFSTPVGDDMLTSTLGINAEGHVLANGQRLR